MPQDGSEIWGDLFAEVPAEGTGQGEAAQWVPVGQVMRAPNTSSATLTMVMYVEPVCWKDHTWIRRLMIAKRKTVAP